MKLVSVVMVLAMALVLCSCTPAPTATPTPLPTATDTPQPTATPKREVWDYVTLGDSFTAYATWPELYASYLEEDLGVEVKLYGRATGNQTIQGMLEGISTSEELRQEIMQAELITVNYGITTFQMPHALYISGKCGGTDGKDCLREVSASAEADWQALLDELVALRSPNQAHIITFRIGTWVPATACDWGSETWDALLTHLLEWNDFVERTAIEHGIHVVDVDRVITGSDYHQPADERYLSSDKIHLSQEGSVVVAGLLRDLGLRAPTP